MFLFVVLERQMQVTLIERRAGGSNECIFRTKQRIEKELKSQLKTLGEGKNCRKLWNTESMDLGGSSN